METEPKDHDFGGTAGKTRIEPDGTLVFIDDAIVWDDLQVVLGTVKLPGVSDPTWTAYKGGYVLAFNKAQDNIITFTAQLRHSYFEGSDIEFHVHTAYPDSNPGDVRWIFTYSWANQYSNFPVEISVTKDIASPADQDHHSFDEIVASIDGTGKEISSILICSLTRKGTDPVDDYDNDVYLAALDFHFQKNMIGSREQLTK